MATRRVTIDLHVGNSTVTRRRANDGQRHLQGRAVRADLGDRAILPGHDAARVALRDALGHHDRDDRSDRADLTVRMM